MDPKIIIPRFDAFLVEKGKQFSAILVGGAALSIMGVISRQTEDCDILDPKIPPEIKQASIEFATITREKGLPLTDKWFNNGPASLKKALPANWKQRITTIFQGKAITLSTLGRLDLLKTKLFALCDRQTDIEDCLELRPTRDELKQCLQWVQEQDLNPDWPAWVQDQLQKLARKLDYEL